MADGVIFNSVPLLAGFIVPFLLNIASLVKKSTGIVVPMISLALFTAVLVVSVIMGAGLREIAIVLMLFLLPFLFDLSKYWKGGNK